MKKIYWFRIISLFISIFLLLFSSPLTQAMATWNYSSHLNSNAYFYVGQKSFIPKDVNQNSNEVFFVDNTHPNASDLNTGLSPEYPLLTINQGAVLAQAGDTVYVVNGTYNETVWLTTNSGYEDFPITFLAEEDVIVKGSGSTTSGSAFYISGRSFIIIEGFNITDTAYKGIFVVNSDHIILRNNKISNAGYNFLDQQQGIHFRNVISSIIEENTTNNNSYNGIMLTQNSNDNIIRNNYSYGNNSSFATNGGTDAKGIELSNSSNNLIINNIVFNNEDTGINLYGPSTIEGSSNNKVIGNLVYGNRDHGIDNNNSQGQIIVGNTVHGNYTSGINLELNSSGSTIVNNIIMDNGINPANGRKPGNVYVDSTSVDETILNYNLYYYSTPSLFQIRWDSVSYSTITNFNLANPTQEVNGLEGDPLFLLPAPPSSEFLGSSGGDYHILPGSPAIDSANSDALFHPNSDIEGNPRFDDPDVANTGSGIREYDDRGAYERQLYELIVSGLVAENKIFDGTTIASINTANSMLLGIENGDDVELNVASIEGIFQNENVGIDKQVFISGLSLNGKDAQKYTLIQPVLSADITSRPITVIADNGQGKLLGDPDPELTYTCSQTTAPIPIFTGSLGRVAGEEMGSYPIYLGSLSAGSNFTITFIPSTFTIYGYQIFLPTITK